MGYKIGIDFGTTNSTVAYINPSSQQTEAFKFPPVEGYEYIPSCVAYHDDNQVAIGRAAFDYADVPDAVFCNNLKMILPMPPENQAAIEWTKKKPPETVITDYLQHILKFSGEESPSFIRQKGEIDGIVLSVPHVWSKNPAHIGRSALQSIVTERLGCHLIQLISEPVAAAAYFAHQHQKQGRGSFSGNILVCDMGGGTFDVTLCRVQPGKIEELFNDGNGTFDMGKAGVQFDTLLLTAKGLMKNSYEFFEAYKKLQEFKSHNHAEITRKINSAIEDPDLYREKTILRAGGRYEFNYNEITTAFEEIRQGIEKVLERVSQSINNLGFSVDRIFFVGGFSQFILVRETIKKCLGMEQNKNDIRLITDINNEIARYAIAFGAALIANDMVSVEEKFEHTIGICGVRSVERAKDIYEQEETLIPILKGGRKLTEYEQPVFADQIVSSYQKYPEISIYVDPSSRNKHYKNRLPHEVELPHADIPGNRWQVGMRINKSKVVYLIFRDTMHNDTKEYELGDIIRKMFGTLVVEE